MKKKLVFILKKPTFNLTDFDSSKNNLVCIYNAKRFLSKPANFYYCSQG